MNEWTTAAMVDHWRIAKEERCECPASQTFTPASETAENKCYAVLPQPTTLSRPANNCPGPAHLSLAYAVQQLLMWWFCKLHGQDALLRVVGIQLGYMCRAAAVQQFHGGCFNIHTLLLGRQTAIAHRDTNMWMNLLRAGEIQNLRVLQLVSPRA
jgi:hypothetical protein